MCRGPDRGGCGPRRLELTLAARSEVVRGVAHLGDVHHCPAHAGARESATFIPNAHCIVTGGGLAPDGKTWVAAPPDFLLPVHVLGALFRGKFLERPRTLRASGLLADDLDDRAARRPTPRDFTTRAGSSYAKRPFGGAEQSLAVGTRGDGERGSRAALETRRPLLRAAVMASPKPTSHVEPYLCGRSNAGDDFRRAPPRTPVPPGSAQRSERVEVEQHPLRQAGRPGSGTSVIARAGHSPHRDHRTRGRSRSRVGPIVACRSRR